MGPSRKPRILHQQTNPVLEETVGLKRIDIEPKRLHPSAGTSILAHTSDPLAYPTVPTAPYRTRPSFPYCDLRTQGCDFQTQGCDFQTQGGTFQTQGTISKIKGVISKLKAVISKLKGVISKLKGVISKLKGVISKLIKRGFQTPDAKSPETLVPTRV